MPYRCSKNNGAAARPCPCGMLCYSYLWEIPATNAVTIPPSAITTALAGRGAPRWSACQAWQLELSMSFLLETNLLQLARPEVVRLMTLHARLCGS